MKILNLDEVVEVFVKYFSLKDYENKYDAVDDLHTFVRNNLSEKIWDRYSDKLSFKVQTAVCKARY